MTLVTSDIMHSIVKVDPWKAIFQENNFVHAVYIRGENHAKQSCCAGQG